MLELNTNNSKLNNIEKTTIFNRGAPTLDIDDSDSDDSVASSIISLSNTGIKSKQAINNIKSINSDDSD